jgi:hypothetical protein
MEFGSDVGGDGRRQQLGQAYGLRDDEDIRWVEEVRRIDRRRVINTWGLDKCSALRKTVLEHYMYTHEQAICLLFQPCWMAVAQTQQLFTTRFWSRFHPNAYNLCTVERGGRGQRRRDTDGGGQDATKVGVRRSAVRVWRGEETAKLGRYWKQAWVDYVERQRRGARKEQEEQVEMRSMRSQCMSNISNSKTTTSGWMSQSWLQLFPMVLGMLGLELMAIISIPRGQNLGS